MTKITENTTVSIAVVMAFLGGVAYVTYVAASEQENGRRLSSIEQRQLVIEQMGTDLAVVRTKVEAIEKKLDHTQGLSAKGD